MVKTYIKAPGGFGAGNVSHDRARYDDETVRKYIKAGQVSSVKLRGKGVSLAGGYRYQDGQLTKE